MPLYELEIEISERRKLKLEADDIGAVRQRIDGMFPEFASDEESEYVLGSLRYDIIKFKKI